MKLSKDQELEYLRLENKQLKEELSMYRRYNLSQIENDLKSIISIASRMRQILIECRQNSLPFEIGRKIDNVLRDANELD